MSFTMTHRDGGMEEGRESSLPHLIAELDWPRDDEHPDVCVSDDRTAWAISAFQSGRLVFENLDDSSVAPGHMSGVTREEVLRLLTVLAHGGIEELQGLAWQPGYQWISVK
jgi:hypothetical protein